MMSNEPPQGAQSADPANTISSLLDRLCRASDLRSTLHREYMGKAMPNDVYQRFDAARSAVGELTRQIIGLAAPEGPAPTDPLDDAPVHASYKRMFEAAVVSLAEIDRLLGVEPDGCNDPETTVSALKDYIAGTTDAINARNEFVDAQYAAPEAPPPVEARQPHNPWRASIENILTGDNYFRAAEWHELLADLDRLYAMPPAVKPLDDPRLQQAFGDAIEGALAFGYQQNNKPPVGHWLNRFWNIGSAEAEKASKPPIVTDEMVTAYLKANDEYWRKVDEIAPPIGVWRNGTPREATRESLRAALAAPAGAIQPNLDHQVGAPVTLSDAANPWCWYCGSSEPTCQKPFDDVPCRRSKQGNGGGL